MAYTTINKSTDYFNTKLYTGNGSARSITGVGFQPDMVWVKKRSHADNHPIHDVIRGATKYILTDTTGAEATFSGGLTSFDSDGYSLGVSNFMNQNTHTFASWNWLANGAGSANTDGTINSTVSANTTAGFSIVKWTGNGTAGATIGHGLGVVPTCMIVKSVSATEHWQMYHHKLGATKYIELSSTAAEVTSSDRWNNTAPTSSVFSVGGHTSVNTNGTTYIAYCFAEKTGYSKFGSYKSTGLTDGPFCYTGMKPKFLLIKNTSDSAEWEIYDSERAGYNDANYHLNAEDSSAEATLSGRLDLLSNGFKIKVTNSGPINSGTSGKNYIYMAIGQSLVGSNNVPCTAR